MRIEIIQEFLVFARHLNFSRAAEELHVAQPSLSKHMRELEQEVGVELIDRKTYGKNRPALSEAGKYFFEEMAYLDNSYKNTLTRCRAIGRGSTNDVRIQELWQNNAMIRLYSLVGAYQGEHPESPIRFMRLSEKYPVAALLEREVDLVFDVWCGGYEQRITQLADQGVAAAHFLTEPPCIWFNKDNRYLQGVDAVGLDELLEIPVIMTRGTSLDYMVSSYADYCRREGLSPRLRHLQPFDNSPTGMFMADFHDGVLMTTPAMTQDPRLRSRAELRSLVIADDRIAVTFLLAMRAGDKNAAPLFNYACARKPK